MTDDRGAGIDDAGLSPPPIAGVPTSTAGMVGLTPRGPLTPRLVTGLREYEQWFGAGADATASFLSHSVSAFFANGGRRLFVARVVPPGATTAVATLAGEGAGPALRLEAIGPGGWGNRLLVRTLRRSSGVTLEVRCTAPDDVATSEVFCDLAAQDIPAAIERRSRLVRARFVDPDAAPAPPAEAPFTRFDGGSDETAATPAMFAGDADAARDAPTGLAALGAIDEIATVAVPDHAHPGVLPDATARAALTDAVVDHCERLGDRFAVLAVEGATADAGDAGLARDTGYAATYHPWVRVADAATGTALVPPHGHVLGIYARTDEEHGVHAAPANRDVRCLVGDAPLAVALSADEAARLADARVNAIRDLRAADDGVRLWGARTMSSDPQWRYVNVRRLVIFLEHSLDAGTQWAVFEPNDDGLWERLRRSVSSFLTRLWRDGALMGAAPDEAFCVRCDRTTMTQRDIDEGRVVCLIGVAVLKPAEFVFVRLCRPTATSGR